MASTFPLGLVARVLLNSPAGVGLVAISIPDLILLLIPVKAFLALLTVVVVGFQAIGAAALPGLGLLKEGPFSVTTLP